MKRKATKLGYQLIPIPIWVDCSQE
jgi:hypothetical protein